MKSFDSDLKKYTDKIRLKASERRALRERVLSYMEYHPLPKHADAVASLPTMLEAEPFTLVHVTRRTMQFASGFLALVLVVLPFAAERSVPGEVLYFIKTGINEPLRSQLASSPYEKIEFETKLMERRIAEARALASQGKLTDDVKVQIAENVKVHTKSVASSIAELQEQDADGAAIARIAFNSSLEVQSAVLNAAGGEDAAAPIGSILTAVNEARGEASVAAEGEPTASYEGLLARVESETARAYELFETVKESATAEEVQRIERRLNDVNRLIVEAKGAHDEQSATTRVFDAALTEEAVPDKLSATLGFLQKLIVFMTNIDVRETVALDTLVPVVLSDEERVTAVRDAVATNTIQIANINGTLATLTDEAVADKVSQGLLRIEELRGQIDTALDAGEVLGAETALTELSALTADLSVLVTPAAAEPENPTIEEPSDAENGTTTPAMNPEDPATSSSTPEGV